MDEPTVDLLDRFRAGDRAAYDVLWKRYRQPLLRFIRHHGDAAFFEQVGADDLLQETHLEALRGLDRFEYRRELAFFFWLCGIARILIANHCRRLQRRPALVRRIAGGPRGAGPGSASSSDLLSLLQSPSPTP